MPTMFCRDVKKACAHFAPTSVRPLLLSPNGSADGITITIASLVARPNGSPIISVTSGVAYSFDSNLFAFVKLSEPWWAEGSDAWSSRPRNSSSQQDRKSTRLNSSHQIISYAVFCLKKKKQ